MRALPSSSRDLPLLLPEWMLFALLQMAACRTLEMLARGTGLRRDATPAPMQVRNGWRPHRRHLTQPASLSKDDRFFVQTMGSTSHNADEPLVTGSAGASTKGCHCALSSLKKHPSVFSQSL
jgi:hypothetical protein